MLGIVHCHVGVLLAQTAPAFTDRCVRVVDIGYDGQEWPGSMGQVLLPHVRELVDVSRSLCLLELMQADYLRLSAIC